MDRRTWAGIAIVAVVAVLLFVTQVLGIPLHMLPNVILGGSPDISEANGTFDHVSEAPHEFEASTDNLTTCGTTCRNFTGQVTYTGEGTASDVRLDMRVTANGSELWTGNQSVGDLDSGEAYEVVQEADIGFGGASTVLSNDGYVTIWIEVHHAGESETLKTRLKAA